MYKKTFIQTQICSKKNHSSEMKECAKIFFYVFEKLKMLINIFNCILRR